MKKRYNRPTILSETITIGVFGGYGNPGGGNGGGHQGHHGPKRGNLLGWLFVWDWRKKH